MCACTGMPSLSQYHRIVRVPLDAPYYGNQERFFSHMGLNTSETHPHINYDFSPNTVLLRWACPGADGIQA